MDSINSPKEKEVKLDFEIPTVADFLKSGLHFGHQVKRWNPLMEEYIYTQRNGLHIIDVDQTLVELEKALKFLVDAASRGQVLFVGTKRQAREIVQNKAVEAGAFFVIHRWVGGLLTNFSFIKRSLARLEKLESDFEGGVAGRTKYEVSKMKKEWERLNRLYAGVKGMDINPTAIVVLDTKYEKNAIKEAKKIGIPVVGVVDTNADPNVVNYPIPANDDAIASIELLFSLFTQAVKQGNKGKGVKHVFKDYSKVDVVIKKQTRLEEQVAQVVQEDISTGQQVAAPIRQKKIVELSKRFKNEGILERVQKAKESKTNVEEPKKSTKKGVAKPKKNVKSEVSARTLKALKDAKIKLADAKKMSQEDLVAIKGIGEKAALEILNS